MSSAEGRDQLSGICSGRKRPLAASASPPHHAAHGLQTPPISASTSRQRQSQYLSSMRYRYGYSDKHALTKTPHRHCSTLIPTGGHRTLQTTGIAERGRRRRVRVRILLIAADLEPVGAPRKAGNVPPARGADREAKAGDVRRARVTDREAAAAAVAET